MNPLSPQVKSVEAFQRDIEPAIIAARNELVTEENFLAYKDGESIARLGSDQEPLYSLHTRLYYFTELDVDRIRDTYNKRLLPLGFELSEKHWTTCGLTRSTTPSCRRRRGSASKPPRTITRRARPRTDPLGHRRS